MCVSVCDDMFVGECAVNACEFERWCDEVWTMVCVGWWVV